MARLEKYIELPAPGDVTKPWTLEHMERMKRIKQRIDDILQGPEYATCDEGAKKLYEQQWYEWFRKTPLPSELP